MADHEFDKQLRALSLSIGDFIRYWGFRRIHGALWAQLFLSREPLSGTELARRLKVSKALVSPALGELEAHKLIRQSKAPNDKTILYEAVSDVNSVIKHVLKTRERPLLAEVDRRFESVSRSKKKPETLSTERLDELQAMIRAANLMLELMLGEDDLMNLSNQFKK